MEHNKENNIRELFFNEPTKHWYFKDIVRESRVQKSSTHIWLKKLVKEKIIVRTKLRGKMPYYVSNWKHPHYINAKRIYGLNLLYNSGLIEKLQQLQKTKAIVIFGSFARADWHTGSDVDVFVYGDSEDFHFGTFWKGLGFQNQPREIQVHTCKSKKEIKEIQSGLMNNVVNGHFIKGRVDDLVEVSV